MRSISTIDIVDIGRYKIVDINPSILIIILNINGVDTPMKRPRYLS